MLAGMAGEKHKLAAAALALLASPAGAQRLDHALGPPRLAYAPLAEAGEIAGPADADSAPGEAPVREYYLDQIELGLARGADAYSWDVAARIGGQRDRIWLEAIGEGTLGGPLDYLELQALYSRAVSGTWDVQAGLRYDLRPTPNRAWLMAGAQGDAADNLYLGMFAFVSHRGELGARAYALLDVPIAGGLILQPSAEVNAFAQDMPALGLGRGFSYGEAGLRLRYPIREWFAPYVGIEWTREFGRTARFTRAAGDDPSGRALLVGLRSWF